MLPQEPAASDAWDDGPQVPPVRDRAAVPSGGDAGKWAAPEPDGLELDGFPVEQRAQPEDELAPDTQDGAPSAERSCGELAGLRLERRPCDFVQQANRGPMPPENLHPSRWKQERADSRPPLSKPPGEPELPRLPQAPLVEVGQPERDSRVEGRAPRALQSGAVVARRQLRDVAQARHASKFHASPCHASPVHVLWVEEPVAQMLQPDLEQSELPRQSWMARTGAPRKAAQPAAKPPRGWVSGELSVRHRGGKSAKGRFWSLFPAPPAAAWIVKTHPCGPPRPSGSEHAP